VQETTTLSAPNPDHSDHPITLDHSIPCLRRGIAGLRAIISSQRPRAKGQWLAPVALFDRNAANTLE
jgi:hypothetical protein